MTYPRRGESIWSPFDPTAEHEIQKTGPALVIQNDVSNQYSPITIVAAISSQFSHPPRPREVIIQAGSAGLSKTSAVILNQIRSVDRRRPIKRLGAVDAGTMKKADEALMISLGLVEF